MPSSKPVLLFLLSWLAIVSVACGDNLTAGPFELDPASVSLTVGEDATITARRGTAEVSGVTWASSDSAVARVTAGPGGEATVRGLAAGVATITATLDGATATATVTVVAAPIVSIAITPPSPSLAAGTSTQLAATATLSDGTTTDVTATAVWASATLSVATIAADGELTGVAVGTSVITATVDGITGTATATVTAAQLIAIDVTPPSPSLARGTTQQLTATGRFSDATTQDLTAQVSWAATGAAASVSAAGLVTAVDVGVSVVAASMGAITGNATVTVTDAALVSIAVTPTNPSRARGLTQQFTATGTFTDATTQNLTTMVVWTSGTPAAATISNAAGSQGLAATVDVGASLITATSGTISGSTTLTVTPATLVSIQVTPVNPSLARGLTRQFTATGTFTDATTDDLTATVTWTSGTPATATISNAAGSQGLATSASVGTTVITATSGTISGSTTLTVTPATVVSIQVTPVNPSVALGRSQQFTATGTFTDATTDDLTATVTWTSGTPATATISNAAGTRGLATSASAGTTVITATSGTISGSTTLTVTPATLVSIQVTPVNPSLALGLTRQFTATGTFTDATTDDLTASATWTSGTPATATISNAAGSHGLATSAGVGTTVITATSGTISGSTTLTVTPATLVSIAVTPADPTLPLGATRPFTATGTFTDATTDDVTATVTWASSNEAVVQVSNAAGSQGLVTAVAVGTATISATSGSITGATGVTVSDATLVSIAVTPGAGSVALGRSQQYTATGTYSDATTQNLTTTVTWASSDATVAQISNAAGSQGLAQSTGLGTATISATSGAITGSATLTVTDAELVSIAVTPIETTVARGTTRQYTAIGTFSDATTDDLTATVTWASSDPVVAQISNAAGSQGLASALELGPTTISATSGTIVGSTSLTVGPPALVSIAVTPVNPSVTAGATVPLTATGTFTDATTQDLTATVLWSSLAPAIASVNAAGVVLGVSGGTAQIDATAGAIVGSTTVTVVAPPPAVLAIAPADAALAQSALTTIAVTFDRAMSPATLTTQVGFGPCSGSVQVSINDFASCIGLGPVTMSLGDTRATTTPAPALAFGSTYKVRVTTAVQSAAGTAMAAEVTQPNGFTTGLDASCASGLVISQVYGGGGNSGSQFNNDFVELHNPTLAPISIDGHALQLTSAAGTTWTAQVLPAVSIPAGGFYLIQEAAGAGTPGPLPTPDFIPAPFAIGAGSVKVALTNTITPLAGACPAGAAIVDLVGISASASCFETAPTAAFSNTTSVQRRSGGCADGNNNSTDFLVAAPVPRNSAPANDRICSCAVNESGSASEADFCNLQHPPGTSVPAGGITENIYGRLFEDGVTQGADGNPAVRAEVGFGPRDANPQNQPGWTWAPAAFNVQIGNDDEYQRTLTAPLATGTYSYTTRFSFDGIRWTYCDLDGAGGNAGLSFDPARLGVLTVTAF